MHKNKLIEQGYQLIKIKLKSGFEVEVFYKKQFCNSYTEINGIDLSHLEFYGKTISETGFKSWFGCIEEIDLKENIQDLCELLEEETRKNNPNIFINAMEISLF